MPSYSPVYSQAFIQYTSATPNSSFDVPDGFTAVVRQVVAYQDIGGYALGVFLKDSEAAPSLQFVSFSDVAIATCTYWSGRIVVPGGGEIFILWSELGATPQFYVGGYLLRNALT